MKEIIREIAGFVMVFAFMFCYVPQIIKIYKTKSSKGLSLTLVLMCVLGYASGLVYMFLTSFGIWWFLNYFVGLVMCFILTHAWIKYREDKEYDSY